MKKYEEAELKIITFDVEDIITTSGDSGPSVDSGSSGDGSIYVEYGSDLEF